MLDISKIIMVTDEENERIKKGIEADPEAYSLTPEEIAEMRPASEVHPELVERWRELGGPEYVERRRKELDAQQAANKVTTTIQLSEEVLEYFQKDGEDWQARMDKAMLEYIAMKEAEAVEPESDAA